MAEEKVKFKKVRPNFNTILEKQKKMEDDEKFAISDSLRKTFTQQEIDEEINKCILVCSNCHVEIHSNLIKLDQNGASIQT